MIVAKIRSHNLSKLLRVARMENGYTQEVAAAMLGYCNKNHLWKAEHSLIDFSVEKLRRACELYGIKKKEIVEAAVEDYREALIEAINE